MREVWRRIAWLFRRGQFERELDEEMRFHLAMTADDGGEARFGNIALLKEDSLAMWSFVFWEQLAQDVRFGWRTMAANRLFTAIAVVSLALGIGANTAIYSFMDAILLRALPVKHPEELVILNWRAKGSEPAIVHGHSGTDYAEPDGGLVSPNLPYPAWELLRDNNHVFASFFGHFGAYRLNVVVDGQAELGNGRYVTGDFFSGLGVTPALGRLLGRDDDRAGAAPVAVLSYDYWRTRFGADPSAAGKTIEINGVVFTIAGVAAPGFAGVKPDEKPVVYLPVAGMGLTDSRPDWPKRMREGTVYWIEAMGRLKPGATLAQSQAELGPTFRHFVESTVTKERERTDMPTLWAQAGGSGVDSIQRQYSKPLWVLMTMALTILAIACANIANLLLARSSARRREMAVRISLGAGRLRVVRQLMTESAMLSLAGGVAGVGVAAMGIRFLRLLMTNGTDNLAVRVGLDWRVLGFTVLVALVTGLLFGLAPAIQSTRVDVTPALKENRASAARTQRFGLSQALVVSQIAMSLVLVAGAGLFVRSLANLHSVQLGFNSENLLTFWLDASKAGYKGAALKRLYSELREQFGAVAGVRAATLSDTPLVAGRSSGTGITVPGIPKPAEGQRGPHTSFAQVGPRFFETMEIPILRGRGIDERDVEGRQSVAVVNEIFANKYFPGVNPVGRHFRLGDEKDPDLEIVGVAKTARYNSLKGEIPPVTYIAFQQLPNEVRQHEMVFDLRTTGDPMALANTVRQIVHQAAPQVPVAEVSTQVQRIEATILQEKIFARLCTCFGGLALVMACVGLYGTMAYAVARRTSEIGIRMALGAERRRIVWMVLRQVLAMSGVGLAIGLAAAWWTTAFVKSFLFELKPNDPWTLGGAVGVLILCAVAAGYAPAWRASRIDPMVALRHE